MENRDLVTATLTPLMQTRTTTEWVAALEAEKIGCGPINTLKEVFADPHVQARGMVVSLPHASGAEVQVIANPVKLSATPPDHRSPPPVLGQHTEAVLSDLLGLSAGEITALREGGVL